jgi:hypothetical protein
MTNLQHSETLGMMMEGWNLVPSTVLHRISRMVRLHQKILFLIAVGHGDRSRVSRPNGEQMMSESSEPRLTERRG